MQTIAKIALPALLLGFGVGCTTTIRNLTAETWDGDGKGVYIAYWEGTCKPFLGCDAGDGKVMWCTIGADNGLSCVPQESANAVLSKKNK